MNRLMNKQRFTALGAGTALLLAGVHASAQDDNASPWNVNATAAGAVPLSGPQDEAYGAGVSGGLGLYRDTVPELELGARVDAGFIADEDQVETTGPAPEDHGSLKSGALNAALRLRPFSNQAKENEGLWLEIAGGPGIVENEVRAVLNPGVGYSFDVGELGIGPSARYTHVIEPDKFGGEDFHIASLGVELSMLPDEDRTSYEPPRDRSWEQPQGTEPVATAPAEPALKDSDGDRWLDADDQCPDRAEVWNGLNDHDGCPDAVMLVFERDRMSIDERVLFEYDSAELSAGGKAKLQEIAELYKGSDGNWAGLRVAGHADRRGPEEYNMDLSRERAQAVKSYLTELGMPSSAIDVKAYGENKPLIEQPDSPAEYRQNRRVEFQILR